MLSPLANAAARVSNKHYCWSPNSNTFPDCRRTCHVPLVKTQWLPWETTNWTLDSHVITLCTFGTAGNLCTGRPDEKSHWSRTFLIRDGIHYSRKGIYSRKNISCRLTKGKIWTFCVSKLLAPKMGCTRSSTRSWFNRGQTQAHAQCTRTRSPAAKIPAPKFN